MLCDMGAVVVGIITLVCGNSYFYPSAVHEIYLEQYAAIHNNYYYDYCRSSAQYF